MFSMWWVVNYQGVVAVQLYESTIGVEKFHDVLREELQPQIKKYARSRCRLEHFFHDHVTNSTELYDVATMNELVERGYGFSFHQRITESMMGS